MITFCINLITSIICGGFFGNRHLSSGISNEFAASNSSVCVGVIKVYDLLVILSVILFLSTFFEIVF